MRSKLAFFGLLSVLAIALFAGTPDTALGQFTYTPLEKIPGASNASTFPQYVQGIYKFGIWTVGLAALFMLSVGGFIYLSSGGNTANIGKAKTYIWDAIIGLVLALLAYLILYVINPDLVNVSLSKFSEVGGVIAPATSATPVVQGKVTPTANETLSNASTITAATYSDVWYTETPPVPAESTDQKNMIAGMAPYGIVVKDSSGHTGTSALCSTEKQAASCTSLYKFPSTAADTLKSLGDACRTFNSNQWCTISITGGTEYWKHSSTTKHMPGNPVVDIGKNSSSSSFFSYLQSVAKTPTCQRGGKNVYTIPVDTAFGKKYVYLWDEDSIHWHVNIDKDMCH